MVIMPEVGLIGIGKEVSVKIAEEGSQA